MSSQNGTVVTQKYTQEAFEKMLVQRHSKKEIAGLYAVSLLERDRLDQEVQKLRQGIKGLTGNEYQALAARTINQKLNNGEKALHALFGMVGEIGEIHSMFQKVYQGHELNDDHLKKELGDLLWFIAEYCTSKEWKLEEVMQMNIDKLKDRYPAGFDADHSLHRKEGDV